MTEETAALLGISMLASVGLAVAAVASLFSERLRYGAVRLRRRGFGSWGAAIPVGVGAIAVYLLLPSFREGFRYAAVCATLLGCGFFLHAYGYVEVLSAAQAISNHPWLRNAGDTLERTKRFRHVYPDWRYLINEHHTASPRGLFWGGLFLAVGGLMGFGFESTAIFVLSGTSMTVGILSLFFLSPTLRGFQMYVGKKTLGERAHSPDAVDRLVKARDSDGDAEAYTRNEIQIPEYPPEPEEDGDRGGWATKVFGLLKGYVRMTRLFWTYIAPTVGFSLAYGIAVLFLLVVFFGVTVTLLPVGERLGISEQTVAAYVGVWVVVALWVFVPGLYLLSKKETGWEEE